MAEAEANSAPPTEERPPPPPTRRTRLVLDNVPKRGIFKKIFLGLLYLAVLGLNAGVLVGVEHQGICRGERLPGGARRISRRGG